MESSQISVFGLKIGLLGPVNIDILTNGIDVSSFIQKDNKEKSLRFPELKTKFGEAGGRAKASWGKDKKDVRKVITLERNKDHNLVGKEKIFH